MTQSDDSKAFKKSFESQFTYIEGFMRNVRRYPNKTAITDVQTKCSWNYQQLNLCVNQLSHALQNDNVVKGDVVIYMMRNIPEFVFCYLSPQKLGAINYPVNYYLTAYELKTNIVETKPKVFLYDSFFKDTVIEALSDISYKPNRIVMVNTTFETYIPFGHISYEDYVSDCSNDEPIPNEALTIYDETTRFSTSGTTSKPSTISLLSINEVLSAHDAIMGFSMIPNDRNMNLTPWFHRGGLHAGGPCPTLYIGGEVVAYRDGISATCLKIINQFQVTFIIGVPSVFNLLCRFQERIHVDLSTLRGIVTMGSPLDRNLCIRIKDILCPNVYNGYGTTETFWNTFLRPSDLPEMAGTAGQSCIDDDVRIVHNYNDHRAEPDDLVRKDNKEVGEIIINSISKMAISYYNNPKKTKEKFYKGFFYTGDLGTWDSNSFITISGRKDDMIVTAGENIHAIQVESIINEHPKVLESCVIGVPDDLRGQVVAAYVLPSDPSLTLEELRNFLYAHPKLAEFKRPKLFCICDELPHTSTGKLQHNKLRDKAQQDIKNGVLKRSK